MTAHQTDSAKNELNPHLARQFFETIFSQYLKETARPAYIEVRGKRRSDVKLTFRRFYLGFDLLIKDMSAWAADLHYWFGVALRWSDTQGEKGHCHALTVIFTDVDYGSAGHKKKNRWQTRGEAQAAIDAFPQKPSIVVHTGGGFQAYWILSEPFGLENGNFGQVEAIMKGIGAVIGGDTGTQDVSRIFRIPGTFNVKTDVPRPVEIVECHPDRIYDLADFAHYAGQGQDQDRTCKKEAPLQDGPQTTDIDALNMPAWAKGLIRTGDASGYDNDRSRRDHAVVGALKRASCNLDTIEAIFREHPIGDKFREKGHQGRKYLQFSYDKDTATSAGDQLDVSAYLAHYGQEVVAEKPVPGGTMYCLAACVFDPAHTDGDTGVLQGDTGVLGFRCFHDSCSTRTWQDARKAISGSAKLSRFMPGWTQGRRRGSGGAQASTNTVAGGKATAEDQSKLDPHIARLNRTHGVAMISGKTVILNEIQDHKGGADITFSSVNDFRNFQANNLVWVNRKKVPVSQLWLESPDRRQYPRGVVFAPGQEKQGAYNLWRGFAVQPTPGDWSRYREHMLNNICAGNEALFNYLLDWMARNVQDPGGERPGVAVVLKSVDFGTGKGVFCTQYGRIFGVHFQHIVNGAQLVGKFNSHLKACALCFVDEGVWGGDRQAAGVLRGLITEKKMMIEPKGVNAFSIDNHMSFFIASNNNWVIPAGFDERRFFVLDVAPTRKQDTKYFGAIVAQMDQGGREAMLYDLLERKITVDLRLAPRTAALLDQVVYGMTTVEKFWFERLRNINEKGHWLTNFIRTDFLYGEYLNFAEACKEKYPITDSVFGKELRRLCPSIRRIHKTAGQDQLWFYRLDNLDICRTLFEKAVGFRLDWDSEEEIAD